MENRLSYVGQFRNLGQNSACYHKVFDELIVSNLTSRLNSLYRGSNTISNNSIRYLGLLLHVLPNTVQADCSIIYSIATLNFDENFLKNFSKTCLKTSSTMSKNFFLIISDNFPVLVNDFKRSKANFSDKIPQNDRLNVFL